jgi:ribosome-binding protein aMBF1 (putative translation factor)
MTTTRPPRSPDVEGHDHRKGHTAYRRRTLPRGLAQALAAAHAASGWSYRQAARRLRIDWSYWRRITRGERCPSRQIAQRIIWTLDLDDDTAQWLLAESVEREPAPPGRPRGRVVR